MTSPVVVDGRTDEEKLHELMAIGAEYGELDFKATLDMGDKHKALDFAKDCISMMNTPIGGYIVIGLDDNGEPAFDHDVVDVRKFDAADLSQWVAKFVDVPLRIYSQSHEVDGRSIVLVVVLPTPGGLPAFIARIGQYETEGRRMKTVLTPGTLYTRSGTQNVAASDGHWPQLLERYRDQIVGETRGGVDALTRAFVASLGAPERGQARTSLPPLLLDMENETFAEAFIQHLEATSDVPFRKFLREAISAASFTPTGVLDTRHNALNKLAIAAIQAAQYEKVEVFGRVIDALHKTYETGGEIDFYNAQITRPKDVAIARHWLDVLLRLHLIGAAAVREGQWWAVSNVTLRPVSISPQDDFPTWLRHGHVYASRAGLLAEGGEKGGLILSMARELGQLEVALRPDVADVSVMAIGVAPSARDPLLDSLAQFDITWCIVMGTTAPKQHGYAYYPSCVALRQQRAQPAITAIATREEVRRELSPRSDDAQFANGLEEVMRLAVSESHRYNSFWEGLQLDSRAVAFVKANQAA